MLARSSSSRATCMPAQLKSVTNIKELSVLVQLHRICCQFEQG